jgi:predicted rRNA pseudouridine synthase
MKASDGAIIPPKGGILILDKPRGPSSHQVTAWVKQIFRCRAGHTGTLDPRVSGILTVMLGPTVRLAPFLQSQEKEYVCLMRLHVDMGREDLQQAIGSFCGRIYQRPPVKSAVARNLRIRQIHQIKLLEHEGRMALLQIRCDAGTYIRSLCHHIGLVLGTGAHLEELRRTGSGALNEKIAHTLFEVQDAAILAIQGDADPLSSLVIPPEKALGGMPEIRVRESAIDAVCHGAALAAPGILEHTPFNKGDSVLLLTPCGEMIGIGEALVPSSTWASGVTGLFVSPRVVIMNPGTFPRGWSSPVCDR